MFVATYEYVIQSLSEAYCCSELCVDSHHMIKALSRGPQNVIFPIQDYLPSPYNVLLNICEYK